MIRVLGWVDRYRGLRNGGGTPVPSNGPRSGSCARCSVTGGAAATGPRWCCSTPSRGAHRCSATSLPRQPLNIACSHAGGGRSARGSSLRSADMRPTEDGADTGGHRNALQGRGSECVVLNHVLEDVRAGGSRALVVCGEPGVGKTALLQYLVGRASGCRVARATAIQSEMELAFAGLHQLCAPMLDRLDHLPPPQRDALRTCFGIGVGRPPDRFLVGLAVLSLLAEVAAERPLLCVVDDAQWLDRASAQTLGFAARRLGAESVGMIFGVRGDGAPDLTGLPELRVRGLPDDDARELLSSTLHGPLDERVRDRIVAETRGNPLALLELPRGLTSTQLAGGVVLSDARTLTGRIEQTYRRRLEALPADTQQLVLVAAAEPFGDPVLVWRAARRLDIGADAAASAASAGLLEIGSTVRFHHPLVRSAIYQAASPEERQCVHGVLAEATDPEVDPDRRAWHAAQAAAAPDEDVAADLEHSAGRAQARGGLAAAAAFLRRSAELSVDPEHCAQRALAAAQAAYLAGTPDEALRLLSLTEACPLDKLQRA